MAKGFLNRLTYNNWLWVTGLLLLVLSVVYQTFAGGEPSAASPTFLPLELFPAIGGLIVIVRDFLSDPLLKNAFSLVLIITGGLFVQHFSSKYRLIRVRSFFSFFWYCVLGATLYPFVDQPMVYCVGLVLVAACFQLFSVSEKRDMNRALFNSSLLLALATLVLNRLIWLLPFLWLAAGRIQALSFRNIAASIVGFSCVYWVIGGISFLFGDFRFLLNSLDHLVEFTLMDFSRLNPIAIIYLVFIGLLLLIACGTFVRQQNLDKLSTRNSLTAVMILWLGMAGIWLTASSSNTAFLFLLMIPSLILYSHLFSLNDSLFTRFLFFMQLLLSLLAFFFYQ